MVVCEPREDGIAAARHEQDDHEDELQDYGEGKDDDIAEMQAVPSADAPAGAARERPFAWVRAVRRAARVLAGVCPKMLGGTASEVVSRVRMKKCNSFFVRNKISISCLTRLAPVETRLDVVLDLELEEREHSNLGARDDPEARREAECNNEEVRFERGGNVKVQK